MNIRGWTKHNSEFRQKILLSLEADIICISETHLNGNEYCVLPGYHWEGFNRKLRHKKSPYNFGGIGIFVRNDIYSDYSIDIQDRTFDGIMGLNLKNKHTDYIFVVFCCYLPPERSPWGRESTLFYSHLLTQLYECQDVDCVVMCGDVNGRIGNLKDFVDGLDNIKERNVLDETVNTHGRTFIDFLNDAKMCVLNGRGNPVYENYTFISTLGRSVVDYFFVPHDNVKYCQNFKVIPISDIIQKNDLAYYLNAKCKQPDHSVISMDIVVLSMNGDENENIKDEQCIKDKPRFNVNKIPDDMFSSDIVTQSLLSIIVNIESNRETQSDVDTCYESLVKVILQEMKNKLPVFNNDKNKKRFKNKKPFWNNELDVMWRNMHDKEILYRRYKGTQRQKNVLHTHYKEAMYKFDRHLRKCERTYKKGLMLETEVTCTNDPSRFWTGIKKLGPRKINHVPMEVYNNTGEIEVDENIVLKKWENEFQSLYNLNETECNFDQEFLKRAKLHRVLLENNMDDPLFDSNVYLNANLTLDEVKKAVQKSKNRKATGCDDIPNEVLKDVTIIEALYHLYQLCLDAGKVPSRWLRAIVTPIPKDISKDQRIPLNYRGISLLCCISKIYSSILNARLLKFAETENILVDEQNGFRPNRSCTDHIFSLNSIVKNRINENKSTFGVFIDFKKAFDLVDRELLLYRMLLYGVNGKFYNSLKAMYNQTESCVKLNNLYTEWFPTQIGVRQGDCLSSSLFALYINDLAVGINGLGKGIKCGNVNISLLMYADDVVILTENENDMQCILDFVEKWCKKWRLVINKDKTKAMHFRKSRKLRSKYSFHIGTDCLDYVSDYKYLGVTINEYLNYNNTVDVLSKAGGRALGVLISKFKYMKDMGFKTFTTLYDSCVNPIINYASEIWGYKDQQSIDNLQNRAMKFFLGVHRYAPNVGVRGDCGWLKPKFHRWLNMCRFWNRLVCMNRDRLTRKIFEYDIGISCNNWCANMKAIFEMLNNSSTFYNKSLCILSNVKRQLEDINCETWLEEVQQFSKLRTYVTFKHECKRELYLVMGLSRKERSLLSQFRLGILPLRIETGRYRGEKEQERICVLCNKCEIENEKHFLLECDMYNEERQLLFQQVNECIQDFDNLNISDKLTVLMTSMIRKTSKYICRAFEKRRQTLYLTE